MGKSLTTWYVAISKIFAHENLFNQLIFSFLTKAIDEYRKLVESVCQSNLKFFHPAAGTKLLKGNKLLVEQLRVFFSRIKTKKEEEERNNYKNVITIQNMREKELIFPINSNDHWVVAHVVMKQKEVIILNSKKNVEFPVEVHLFFGSSLSVFFYAKQFSIEQSIVSTLKGVTPGRWKVEIPQVVKEKERGDEGKKPINQSNSQHRSKGKSSAGSMFALS